MATITESFNTANSDTLGPDLTWTELTGDIDIVSNQARTTPIDNTVCRARAETALTANHYVQAACGASEEANAGNVGVMGRKDNTATLTFYLALASFNGNSLRLFKIIAGVSTQLGSTVTETLTAGTPITLRLECNGSTIRVLMNGVEKISVTDSDITGNTFTGIYGQKNTSGFMSFDSFEAGDLIPLTSDRGRRSRR